MHAGTRTPSPAVELKPTQALAAGAGKASARLAYADGLRGLAALWVVLFHASEGGHLDRLKALMPPGTARFFFDWGHLGVALFFVLSGFVMMHSVRSLAFTPQVGMRFMARRLLRLSPPYWASIVFVVAYAAFKSRLVGETWEAPSLQRLLAHGLYLQDILHQPTLSIVYWTLCIEIQFYLAFTLLMLARQGALDRGWPQAGTALLLASAAVSLPWAFGWLGKPLYDGGFLSFWYAYMLGVLVSARQDGPVLKAAFWVFTALVLAAGWVTGSGYVGAALAATAILWLGAHWQGLRAALTLAPLQFLGLVSYSLYLIHNQVTGAAAFVLKRWLGGSAAGEAGLLLAVLALCLLAASLGYWLVERPSIRASRNLPLRPAAPRKSTS